MRMSYENIEKKKSKLFADVMSNFIYVFFLKYKSRHAV